MAYGGKNDDVINDVTTLKGQCCDPDNFRLHYVKHGLRCTLDSVTVGHLQEIFKNANINVKNCSLSPS